MAKQVWGRHAKHLTTSQDNTKEISTNEWNDNTNRKGHLGFDPITIASGSTVTPPAFSTTVANQPSSFIKLSGSTSVDTIATTNTSEGDLLYITTTGSVTLNNTTSPSSAGDIRLLGNANKDLDTNVPTILIRSGNFWYEYGGSPVTDASITFAKIQNLASMKVIGRTAGSSGVSSEVALLDEDNMASDSATSLATQQSIKAYVDSQSHSNVTASSTTTFTNKTIDADGTGNSITNIEDANIKASAAIDASKIADGSVSNAEFQRLDGLTSDIQGQIDGKSPTAGSSSLTTVGAIATGTWEATDVAVAHGGTGSSTASAARTALGVAIGSDVQIYNANTALTTNKISDFASSTSAELAGKISDETGSGVLVFATSPTLVTPALGTPSALVGTNITGTAANLTAGNATLAAGLSAQLVVASGGTNLTSYTAGDLLYATGSTTLAKLAKGTAGQALQMNSGATAPEWAAGGGGAHTEQEWDVYTTHTPSAAVADTDAFMFTRKIDTNNDGLYIQIWKNGASTTVQIA